MAEKVVCRPGATARAPTLMPLTAVVMARGESRPQPNLALRHRITTVVAIVMVIILVFVATAIILVVVLVHALAVIIAAMAMDTIRMFVLHHLEGAGHGCSASRRSPI